MTEERYTQIDQMRPEELNQISDEEYKEYTRLNYLKRTDQKSALDDLLANVNTAQQGYLDIWPTGFSELDKKLDGGFLGGNLILLGAISSLGKTTFAMQLGEQIAEQGKDVLVFSLEMSKNELNAKSISRNTYKLTDGKDTLSKQRRRYILTMSDILRGRVGSIGEAKRELFDEALGLTAKATEHLFILRDNKISVDRIEEFINAHKEARGQRPFVIIDYLQILKASANSQSSDKRLLTDEDVNNLKDMAVRHDIPILVISSFNRANYLEPVSMGSFKESGSIEYSSDTLIGLQYSGMQYQKHWLTKRGGKKILVYESKLEHDTRVRQLTEKMDQDGAEGLFLPIDVVLLKNRGISKGKLLYEFCPKYNIFKEKEDQDDQQFLWGKSEFEEDDASSSKPAKGNKKTILGEL